MAVAKRQQTSALLYTLITFIGLFIISTTFAIVYYVKFEEQRKVASDAKSQLEQVASETEMRKGLGQIVGTIPARKTALGVMVEYLDQLITIITGQSPSDISADLKIQNTAKKVIELIQSLPPDVLDIQLNDPNSTGLERIVNLLSTELRNTRQRRLDLQDTYEQLQAQYDDAIAIYSETEQRLNAELSKYKKQADDTLAKYQALETLFEQSAEEQIKTINDELKLANSEIDKLEEELLKKEAELVMTKEMMKRAQAAIESIKPMPDSNAPAYMPDGKIILVDTQTGIVHINIGSNDRVYRGLTFAIYNKNLPIPKTGEGKAEVEVFDVGQTISAARITTAIDPRNPIIKDDIIANLIWDSKRTNVFVVSGEFEYGDEEKIKSLIQKWGGKVNEVITVETDYVVLGQPPKVPARPTPEEQEIMPTILEQYEASRKRLENYKNILSEAKALAIPIFNTERFLYFIGYKEKAGKPGAF